jgi:hypothetical protein
MNGKKAKTRNGKKKNGKLTAKTNFYIFFFQVNKLFLLGV